MPGPFNCPDRGRLVLSGKLASRWQLRRSWDPELGIGLGREFGPRATLGVTGGSGWQGVGVGPGNQGFVELNGVGGLVLGAASAEVADHAGEGRQPEAGLDDPLDEVVGFGWGLGLGLGRGPIRGIPLRPCGRGLPGRGPGPICGVGRGRGTLKLRGSFLSHLSEVGNPGGEGVLQGLNFFMEQLRFVEFGGLIGMFGRFLAEFFVF